MPDVPERPDERCAASVDGSPRLRCQRPHGHPGLHRWQSADRRQTFDWG